MWLWLCLPFFTYFSSRHTSQEPEVSHPCPVYLALSGHLRVNLTKATSTKNVQHLSHPTHQCHPLPPSAASQAAPVQGGSSQASIPLDLTWIWTYGIPLQTVAPTPSSPTIPATVVICEGTEQKWCFQKIKQQKNVLLSLLGKCEYSFFYVCCCGKVPHFVVYFSRCFAGLTVENKKKVLYLIWCSVLQAN